jgi:hypothetical protein
MLFQLIDNCSPLGCDNANWSKQGSTVNLRRSNPAPLMSKADILGGLPDVRFTPQKRTSELSRGMSALCHFRTLAAQQASSL